MNRDTLITAVIVGGLAAPAQAQPPDRVEPAQRPARTALEYFASVLDGDYEALLRRLRRPAPSDAARSRVIRTLPSDGELVPSRRDAVKLNAIRPVLAFHRRTGTLAFRLFTVGGLAFVGLHARTVLLISKDALDLLSRGELLAVTAHELGHDYVWTEYEQARRRHDNPRLQALELRCDGIAVITLDRLGLDPELLVSATSKLLRSNGRIIDTTADRRYVSQDERTRFIRSVAGLVRRRQPRLTPRDPAGTGPANARQE